MYKSRSLTHAHKQDIWKFKRLPASKGALQQSRTRTIQPPAPRHTRAQTSSQSRAHSRAHSLALSLVSKNNRAPIHCTLKWCTQAGSPEAYTHTAVLLASSKEMQQHQSHADYACWPTVQAMLVDLVLAVALTVQAVQVALACVKKLLHAPQLGGHPSPTTFYIQPVQATPQASLGHANKALVLAGRQAGRHARTRTHTLAQARAKTRMPARAHTIAKACAQTRMPARANPQAQTQNCALGRAGTSVSPRTCAALLGP